MAVENNFRTDCHCPSSVSSQFSLTHSEQRSIQELNIFSRSVDNPMGSPIQIPRPINYIILVPIFFKWTPPIREKVATILLFRLFSGQAERHLRHRVLTLPFLRFWDLFGSQNCYYFIDPWLPSIVCEWFTLCCLLFPWPVDIVVTYFAGIFPCSAAASCVYLFRSINRPRPTNPPTNQWHTDAVAVLGTESRALQNISLIVGTEQKAHDAHQRSTPIRGCCSRLIEEIRDAKR